MVDPKKEKRSIETAWNRCADDYECAFKCPRVGEYERIARIHYGGPNGCKYVSVMSPIITVFFSGWLLPTVTRVLFINVVLVLKHWLSFVE